MSNWIIEGRKRIAELNKYCDELEARYKLLEERITACAAGCSIEDDIKLIDPKPDSVIRWTAANGLLKLSKMPLRKRPSAYL